MSQYVVTGNFSRNNSKSISIVRGKFKKTNDGLEYVKDGVSLDKIPELIEDVPDYVNYDNNDLYGNITIRSVNNTYRLSVDTFRNAFNAKEYVLYMEGVLPDGKSHTIRSPYGVTTLTSIMCTFTGLIKLYLNEDNVERYHRRIRIAEAEAKYKYKQSEEKRKKLIRVGVIVGATLAVVGIIYNIIM